ncbi:uncharacterized protein SPSK_06959 [Sporothrix schenckii 1099-18]|uniref:Zn(2)-C6 fungal-type domain-containing protein n=1 Tax=Sporothrix schenckii 1099-18 TaxID=1397361 RepID=A0A0F2MF39_SPOSC|nr:uncharacterized protein SPSK_06959 [Sporothrix schenckii 1099-18]KJR88252.1 hypothetical protein SPSK_06959 [Sporothrix schenckii 1099-18]
MDKRGLAANADETLTQQYPTPTAEGQAGATSFYNATGADVSLDQIDPQLGGMQSDESRGGQLDDSAATTEANVRALVAAVNGSDDVDVSMGGDADESYPELHLRALKTEDTGPADDGSGGVYGGAAQADHHPNDENNMYAAAALEHVQQAAAAQQAESQDGVAHDEHQQHQQPHEQEHNPAHDQPQQGVRAPVSVEELQLAAQLSQGLAPMMREANARREGEFHDATSGVSSGADAGAGLHDGQDDAEALRVAAAAAAAAAADGTYGSPDVTSAYHHTLQHPADVQGVSHLPASLQMAHMAQQYNVDHIPPRKRSKVSRACDACRRKKIKCDAVSETEHCTNCRRARMECLFSRVPQKRGPSKGYIKELADRINSIEGKLGNQSPASAADALELLRDAGDAANGYARYSLNENAKRPFANISEETPDGSPQNNNRHTAWATTTPRTPYSAVSLAPQPHIDGDTPNALSRSLTDMERLLPLADHESQELDDAVFACYLTAIHPCLPFLPSDRSRVLDNLAQCPQFLQDAFVVALRAVSDALGSVPTTGLARVASALLAQWETEGSARTSLHDLVHLQTLLLLAIEADTHGPASLKGHHGGLSKTALLSRAVAVSYEMDLPQEQLGATVATISAAAADDPSQAGAVDTDSEARLGLRAWWSLVVLDRWNAVALGKPLLIPLRSVVLSPGLRPLLGESAFQFTKLSYLLGSSIAPALVSKDPLRQLQTPSSSSSSAAFLGPLSQQLDLGLEMWRADLPDSVTESAAPLVHLGYWQYRLLAYLLQPSTLSSDVSWATKKVVELTLVATDAKAVSRRAPGPPISPFHHYFICLSGLILAELSKVAGERQVALRTLNDLLEVVAPKPIPVEGGAEGATEVPNSSVWNGPLRETLARRLKSSPSNATGNNANSTASAGNPATLAAAAVAAAAAAAAAVEAAVTASEGDASAAANSDSTAESAQPAAPPAAAPEPVPAADDSGLRSATNYENLGFNPLALLRGGFLNTVNKMAVVTPAVATTSAPVAPEANLEGSSTPQEASVQA